MDQAGDRNKKIINSKNRKQVDPSILIKKIILLVDHQVTKNNIERHAEKINEFIDISRNGFIVTDLGNVMYLIELLVERINQVSEFGALLEEIIRICFVPPVLTKSSDVLTYSTDFQHYFTLLGYLLVFLKDEKLIMLIAVALTDLLSKSPPDRSYLSLDARIKFAEKSQLPAVLSHLLQFSDDKIYPKILHIVHLLTKDSGEVCKLFIYHDAINSLLTRLEPTWRERYPNIKPGHQPIDNILYYEESSTILWTLLHHLSKNKNNMKEVKNITVFSLWSLQYVYRLFVTSRHKQLYRNNSLVIIIKLMELFPKLDFVKSGLAEDLICFNLSPLYEGNSYAGHVRLTLNDDDSTYLQLLLTFVSHFVNFIGGLRLLEDYRIIHRLLKMSINQHTVVWPKPQVCVIAVATLDVMKRLVPYIEEEFIENAGPTIMLNILESYQVNDSDINVLRKCLETINHILKHSTSNLTLNSILFNGGVNTILGLCENIMSKPIDQIMKEKSLGIAFCVLDTLYEHSPTMDKSSIIDLAIKFMKQMIHSNPKEHVHDNRLIICLINFTWEQIIKSEKYALQFVRKNGAFLMLDIIQKFPFAVQLVTLGALVDLCEYGHCIPYLITWRGNGEKITPMLMRLFRNENEKLKVRYGSSGQILDTKFPIMGKVQWSETFCGCPTVNANPVCADLFLSCRPKIYALLQMLNVRFAETVQIADDHYKSYNNCDLEPKDQVTMLLAEHFLALKLGEAWVELKMELDRIPITLTRIDDKILSSIINRYYKWSSYLQKKQNNILQDTYYKDLIEEQNLYNHLQEARLAEALQALCDLKYVARCSERMFRVSQKFIRNSQIEKSVRLSIVSLTPHKTYFSKICVTPVFNQIINVASKVGRTSQQITTLPVSPSVSHNSLDIDVSEDLLDTPSDINKNFQE